MRMGRVLEMYPDLTRDGLGYNWLRNIEEKPDPNCVDICIRWLWKNRDTMYRRTYNRKFDSYHFKHLVETDMGKYVANGDFICAAVMCGYHIKIVPHGAPNVFLNMNVPQSPKE